MTTPATYTTEATVIPGAAGRGGYRRLRRGPGEAHVGRRDLGGPLPATALQPLLAFVQVSDLHVIDAQSPARVEFLDRLADLDWPLPARIASLGTYRPQESLSFQVVEGMARAVRGVEHGPVTGRPLAFAIVTGDNADNGQRNEIEAYIAMLDGHTSIRPDSGSSDTWEGVGSPAWYDVRYWHPDGTPKGEVEDLPRGVRGFPQVPGLLDACRQPFTATGLGLPWYEVHGNDDQLRGGTLPAEAVLSRLARGDRKPFGLAGGQNPVSLVPLLSDHQCQPPDLRQLGEMEWRTVTEDGGRASVGTAGWLLAHIGRGHRSARSRPWYAFDAGEFRCLVLDTVNANGGWQGSLDLEQWAWLQQELEEGSSRWTDAQGRSRHANRAARTFLLFSHHPMATLVNDWSPGGERRVLGAEVANLLARFPNVVPGSTGIPTYIGLRTAGWGPSARPARWLVGGDHRISRRLAAAVPGGGDRPRPPKRLTGYCHNSDRSSGRGRPPSGRPFRSSRPRWMVSGTGGKPLATLAPLRRTPRSGRRR